MATNSSVVVVDSTGAFSSVRLQEMLVCRGVQEEEVWREEGGRRGEGRGGKGRRGEGKRRGGEGRGGREPQGGEGRVECVAC